MLNYIQYIKLLFACQVQEKNLKEYLLTLIYDMLCNISELLNLQ